MAQNGTWKRASQINAFFDGEFVVNESWPTQRQKCWKGNEAVAVVIQLLLLGKREIAQVTARVAQSELNRPFQLSRQRPLYSTAGVSSAKARANLPMATCRDLKLAHAQKYYLHHKTNADKYLRFFKLFQHTLQAHFLTTQWILK